MKKESVTNLFTAAIISVAFFLTYNLSAFAYTCQSVRDDVIRLHILANSNTEEDQELKLNVRDAVLNKSSEIFSDNNSFEKAEENLENNLSKIKDIVQQEIKNNGYDYETNVYIDYEYFSSRVYENTKLPAGKYLALKIIIGSGDGNNWWCVIYPSLCLPAASKTESENLFTKKQEEIINEYTDYEIRFKLIEYIEKFKSIFNSQKNKHR